MSPDAFVGLGYAGLFAVSFLAATLLPLGSETAVAAMPLLGFSVPVVLAVATAGNTLGALTNYAVGRLGARTLAARWVEQHADALERGRRLYARWGAPVLFFSWVPVIGDPLTAVAGVLRAPLGSFLFWVTLGKLTRYAVVLGLVEAVAA